MKRLLLTFCLTGLLYNLNAQQTVSIGTTTTNNKAVLLLQGNGTQGLIIPIVTSRGAVNAAGTEKGMLVYDNSDNKLYYFNGGAWVEVATGTGSAGTYTMALNGGNLELRNGATVVSTIALGSDILNTAGALTVNGLKGKTIPALPATAQALVYNGTNWVFQPLSASAGDITSIVTNAGSGLQGGVTTGDATLSLTNTTVTAGSYGSASSIPVITVDAQGRITNATGIAPVDASTTNEIQNLALAGATGSVTAGEVFNVNISSGTGLTITEGTNVDITRSGTNLTIGASLTGAIMTGTVAGGDLTGTYPNPTLAAGAVSGGVGGDITDASIVGADIANTTITVGKLATGGAPDANKVYTTNASGVAQLETKASLLSGTIATGSAAGGDLTGTYPNPTIAAGAISGGVGGEITDGSIVDADLGTISGTKVTPNFGAQNIVTTGTLSSGAFTTTSTASIQGAIGLGAANDFGVAGEVLTSQGPGLAPTWVPATSTFSTANYIPRGDGAGLISSSFFDNGTFTGLGTSTALNASTRFDIQTSFGSGAYGGMHIKTTEADGRPFYGYATGGTVRALTYVDGADNYNWKLYNGGDRITVTSAGYVGIGTTAPNALLELQGGNLVLSGDSGNPNDPVDLDFKTFADAFKAKIWVDPTANKLYFSTNTTPASNKNMTIDESGQVGMGLNLTSPLAQLHIKGMDGSFDAGIRLEDDASATEFANILVGQEGLIFNNRTVGNDHLFLTATTYSAVTSPAMVIKDGGDVGIGTLSPVSKLEVYENVNSANIVTIRNNNAGTSAQSRLAFTNDVGSANISFFGSNFSSAPNTMRFANNSDPTDGGAIDFITDGAIRLRIGDGSESGNVGIGRTATTNKLEVAGDASKNIAGSWVANSDRRIKTEIKDVENAIETLKKLRPVTFRYTDYWLARNPEIKNRIYYNFIAQEYRNVFPETVKGSGEYIDGDADEILQIDTYNAEIVTIKAVQELIDRVEKLEKENAQLKTEKQQLENDVKAELAEIKRMLGSEAKATPAAGKQEANKKSQQ